MMLDRNIWYYIIVYKLFALRIVTWSCNCLLKQAKLVTVVEGVPKVLFSIADGEGATPSPGLLYFTLDTHLIMLSVKQGSAILSLSNDLTWSPRPLGELARTMSRLFTKDYY